jgi:outer membrane protein insertion porin family
MENSLMEMYSIFGEGGYIYASVVPHESVRSDTIVDVEYEIVENNPAHVRLVDIEGNRRTREKVIRREIDLMPGRIFKRSLLVKSQRAVFNLGFFEDVLLDSKPVNEQGDIDLIFQVKEKATGQIGMGVAYSATDKMTGYLTLSIPNLMGRGESSYIKLETGEKKKNVEVGFVEPWLFDTPMSAGLDLFYVTRERVGYNDKHVGASVTASRPIPWPEYTKAYWTYTLEKVEYNVDDSTKVGSYILSQVGKRTASSTRLTLVRDSRDSFFNATMGTRNMVMGEFSGGYLGGQVKYQKYEAESRWYHPFIWKNAVMLRVRGGYVDGYTAGEVVPVSERFLLGGVGDWGLRGYSDFGYDIGPRDSFGNPLGGKVALVTNAEYKIFLAKGIYWLFFADAGNIWEGLKDVKLESKDDLKKGAGFGIRLEIPMMGVMGFDFGYGFDQKNPSWQPHFQIGTTF